MTKYIGINGKVYFSKFLSKGKALEDSMLNDGRRRLPVTSTGKRNLYVDFAENVSEYFPDIFDDYNNQRSSSKQQVKVYFSIFNFITNNKLVNNKKKSFSEAEKSEDDLLTELLVISDNKTHFFINAELSNAGYHGISLKRWQNNKELIYDVLFPDTRFNLFVFSMSDEHCVYCEFIQSPINNVDDLVVQTMNPKCIQKIFYGAPGTGKSHKVKALIQGKEERTERVTFHPEYDYASFVGGYKPTMNGENIRYEFVPQALINIYIRAWNDLDNDYYLVIEEINRGNCAEIFGDIFQLLDRSNNYKITPSKELKEYLNLKLSGNVSIDSNNLLLPPNLNILATMNTSDQSLFPMDSAFKRRWDWEYVPIDYESSDTNNSSKYNVILSENESFSWLAFIKAVNSEIKANDNLGMDKCLGNYFIKPEANRIECETFINKAIFYLWNDVFKDETEEHTIFKDRTTYEDFFPAHSNGIEKVKEILKVLKIEIVTTE